MGIFSKRQRTAEQIENDLVKATDKHKRLRADYLKAEKSIVWKRTDSEMATRREAMQRAEEHVRALQGELEDHRRGVL